MVAENQRVLDMKDQLQKGVAEKVGAILKDSHKSLRYLYEVSCEEIDYLIEISEGVDGWYGGRIIGGGFGGCSLHLIADNMIEKYRTYISKNFGKKHVTSSDIIGVQFTGGLRCTI